MANVKREKLVKPAVIADFLGCHKATVCMMARTGTIPVWWVGKNMRFDFDAVIKALENLSAMKLEAARKALPEPNPNDFLD